MLGNPQEYLALTKEANSIGKCPLCGSAVEDKAKAFFCSNRACKFALWKNNRYFASIGKSMTSATAQKLLGSGKVKLKNCKSERTGNTFDATVFMEVSDDGKTKFSMEFENGGNSDARRYMAQRAELLGAIRLPNDAFKKNAGTEVVSDILFLQKRDHPIDIVPEWVNLDRTEEGHTMNSYFVAHPEMVLGDTVEESTAYGMDITVRPIEGMELSELLKEAVSHIQGTYQAVELPEADKGKEIETIPATPDVKNFSFFVYVNCFLRFIYSCGTEYSIPANAM